MKRDRRTFRVAGTATDGTAVDVEAFFTAHEGDIVAARESMARSVRAIAQLIYADIRPELTDAQRLRAESFLHKGE